VDIFRLTNVVIDWASRYTYWQHIPMVAISVWFIVKRWVSVPPDKIDRKAVWTILLLGGLCLPLVHTFFIFAAQSLGFVHFSESPSQSLGKALLGGFTDIRSLVIAPVVEELFFRIFLFGLLLKIFKQQWLAVLLGSIIFGAMHSHGLFVNMSIIFIGIALHYVYIKHGFWVSVVTHSLCNLGISIYFTTALYFYLMSI
jgi:membrane protease YdiL (CAAX protease family)